MIRVNTIGYGGKKLMKQVKVHTAGEGAEILVLKISGSVEKIAEVTPNVVHLIGSPEDKIESIVSIVPSEKYDFSILDEPLTSLKNIDAVLKKSDSKEKKWELLVTNKRKSLGRYYEVITLKTDSVFQPELTIRVFGNIQPKGAQPLTTP